MTGPQTTFVVVLVGLSSMLTIVLHRSVLREARSVGYALLATVLASTLTALMIALLAGAVHHAILSSTIASKSRSTDRPTRDHDPSRASPPTSGSKQTLRM